MTHKILFDHVQPCTLNTWTPQYNTGPCIKTKKYVSTWHTKYFLTMSSPVRWTRERRSMGRSEACTPEFVQDTGIHFCDMTHVIMRITTVACYVIQQNNCVCANQSGLCTCTHKIIYHRAFRALLLQLILRTVVVPMLKNYVWFHCNTIFVLFTVRSTI